MTFGSKHLKMYSCNKCNNNFKNWSKLMEHKTRRTPCRPPTHHCERYNKGFASYRTLWKHKQMCQGQSHVNYPVGHKRSADIPTESFERPNGDGLPKRSKNPEIQTLLNEIINDAEPEPSKASLPASRPVFQKQPLSDPPVEDVFRMEDFTAKIVADAFPSTKIVDYSDTDDEESHPKGDIMGYSNEDNGDDDDGDDDDREQDEGTEERIVVPDTDQGLKDRFNHPLIKFTREKQYEHAHELTLLLDEMLDRGLVAPIEYNNLNSLIVISDKSSYEEEEEEEEDERTRVIKDTVDHVIQHDKEELSDLLMELRDEVGKEFLDALLDLELLAGKFLIDEFQEGKPLLPLIEEQRLKLEASPASLSKLLRVKMLLSDINNNRRCVQELFQRIADAEDKEEDIWKLLARQGLIPDEQFEKLSKLDNTDIETIASILKGVKIDQWIPF